MSKEDYSNKIYRLKAEKEVVDEFRISMFHQLRDHKVSERLLLWIVLVEHDNLENKVISLENFADKYMPLVAQNITCDTLTQVIGHKERKKLELYEQKVYQSLHHSILKDNGNPNLEGHRDRLLNQINNKLTIIK